MLITALPGLKVGKGYYLIENKMKAIQKAFFIVLAGGLSVLISCKAKKDNIVVPNYVYSTDKMALGILTLHLHSIAAQNIYKSQRATAPMVQKTAHHVLDSLGMDTTKFRQSYEFYSQHPDFLKEALLLAKQDVESREEANNSKNIEKAAELKKNVFNNTKKKE